MSEPQAQAPVDPITERECFELHAAEVLPLMLAKDVDQDYAGGLVTEAYRIATQLIYARRAHHAALPEPYDEHDSNICDLNARNSLRTFQVFAYTGDTIPQLAKRAYDIGGRMVAESKKLFAEQQPAAKKSPTT